MKYVFTQIKDDIASVKAMYPDIDDNKFYELLKLDPTYKEGVNSVGTYGKWILNLYKKGNLKEEDFYKVPEYLTSFEKKKKLIKNKDIGTYKSLPELVKVIEETKEPEQSQNQIKKAISRTDIDTDAEFIGDFGKYVCYSPKTYEASCKLGKGTHWCTATNSTSGYYENYASTGKLYIFIDKASGQAEYQFHFETTSFMDKDDSPISLGDFIEEVPSSKKFILENIKRTINKWDIWKIIGELGELAVNFIDEIKERVNSSDRWDKKYVISSIIRNKYLEPYFEKEIEEIIKHDAKVAVNYLFNKEKREIYKDYFNEYFELKDNKVEISGNDLRNYLYNFGNTNLSSDFIDGCLREDLWEYFNYYDAVDTSYGKHSLDEDNIKRLKNLHIEYENIPDEYRYRAVSDGWSSGSINECLKDFDSALEDTRDGEWEGLNIKEYIPKLKRIDEFTFVVENFTLEDYFKLLDACKDKVDTEDTWFDEAVSLKPEEVIPYILAHNFNFDEPRYGWQDFDEESFNYGIDEGLYAIETGEEEPEFDDDEELEEWHKWFDNNYEVGLKKETKVAEGQQRMDLGDSKYVFTKDEENVELEDRFYESQVRIANSIYENLRITEIEKNDPNIIKIDDKIFIDARYKSHLRLLELVEEKEKTNVYNEVGQLHISSDGEMGMYGIAPQMRGKGYGNKLVKYAVEHCGGTSASVHTDNYSSLKTFMNAGLVQTRRGSEICKLELPSARKGNSDYNKMYKITFIIEEENKNIFLKDCELYHIETKEIMTIKNKEKNYVIYIVEGYQQYVIDLAKKNYIVTYSYSQEPLTREKYRRIIEKP